MFIRPGYGTSGQSDNTPADGSHIPVTSAPSGMTPYRDPAPAVQRPDSLDTITLLFVVVALAILMRPRESHHTRDDVARDASITCAPFCEVDVAPAEGHRLRAVCVCPTAAH